MRLANGLRIGAEVLLDASIMIMLIVSINEIFTRNHASVALLAPTAVFVLFMWLGWIHLLETGVGLIVLAIIVVTLSGNVMRNPFAWLMMGVSTLITGLLLLGAGWKFRKTI